MREPCKVCSFNGRAIWRNTAPIDIPPCVLSYGAYEKATA